MESMNNFKLSIDDIYFNLAPYCGWCGVPDREEKPLKRCSKCRDTQYCSSECQVKDWKIGGHKESCASKLEPYKLCFKRNYILYLDFYQRSDFYIPNITKIDCACC